MLSNPGHASLTHAGTLSAFRRHMYPNRKRVRDPAQDYAGPGAWFVTLDAVLATCVFGAVVDKRMLLNELGMIARRRWLSIPEHFGHVRLDAFVIMPNHVHGILVLAASDPRLVTAADCKPRFGHPVPGSLGTIIGAYKAVVTRDARQLFGCRVDVWQDDFHDRRLHCQDSLDRARDYIANNPARWRDDYHARNGQPRSFRLPPRLPPVTESNGGAG